MRVLCTGYKFNVHYPDLVDRKKTPYYTLVRDPESEDGSTCLIVFKASCPYEDVAFRIVNKEWELSSRRGFKSAFDRGVLHVFFRLKRARYRK